MKKYLLSVLLWLSSVNVFADSLDPNAAQMTVLQALESMNQTLSQISAQQNDTDAFVKRYANAQLNAAEPDDLFPNWQVISNAAEPLMSFTPASNSMGSARALGGFSSAIRASTPFNTSLDAESDQLLATSSDAVSADAGEYNTLEGHINTYLNNPNTVADAMKANAVQSARMTNILLIDQINLLMELVEEQRTQNLILLSLAGKTVSASSSQKH